MIDSVRDNSKIMWQECDDNVPEPAILICVLVDGLIELQQEGRWVLINKESVRELCKLLKELNK